MDKEIIKVEELENAYKELEQQLQLFDSQIQDLENFEEALTNFIKSKTKNSFSSIGKGIYVKSEIKQKDLLLVEVGANILIQKTPLEIKKVIENQIKRLQEARLYLHSKLEEIQNQIQLFTGDA